MANTSATLLKALDLLTRAPEPEIEALGAVRRSHISRVRSITEDKNVVAVGISEKESDGERTGELSVCFYVRKKIAPSKVKASHALPPVLNVPGDKAVFTDVKEIGELAPEVAKKGKPLQSGFSVGHVRSTAGTLGAIVKRDGKLFLLSNSHVLARSGKGKPGDQIVYPGPADGGAIPANLVATLTHFNPFDTTGAMINRVDAALAEIDASRLGALVFDIHKATAPLGVIKPKRGMTVAKAGRTTGKTTGEVIDVNFRFALQYPGVAGKVGYLDQVLCTRYTDGGDSGSIVVDTESGKIVGLHFAGANGGSVFNPIHPVMSALKFKFTES
ncbi:hypothetical protein [Methylibium sp.]|uniref:hypothetical protein n=1 Tax=Methylibium sp. TaxID=2067992 RepID=UPI003D14EA09